MNNANIIVTTMLLTLLFSCGTEHIASSPFLSEITIDGTGSDWEPYPLQYNEELNFVYGTVQADSFLYTMLRFNDVRLARMFGARGLVLWTDAEKKFGIKYVDHVLRTQGLRPGRQDINTAYIPSVSFSIVGNDSILAPDIDRYPQLKAAFSYDDGLYCFEYKIPYMLLNANGFAQNLTIEQLELGLELLAVDEDLQQEIKGQMRRGAGGAGFGGMAGGGRRDGMGGGRAGRAVIGRQSQMDFDSKEFWFIVSFNN